MKFHVITIFPRIFDSYFNESILKRAQKNNLIEIKIHDLRQWTTDKHKTVDDRPFGGGAGMVMKIEPIYKALRNITAPLIKGVRGIKPNSKIILLSAKGETWNQQLAQKYSKLDNIILICGRYEGVDERVKKFVDEEISVGNYILTGGELPAMTIIDSITRLLPNALGNKKSLEQESFNNQIKNLKSPSSRAQTEGKIENHYLEYPQYTRPEVFVYSPLIKGVRGIKKYRIPKILLSGNHDKIEQWRKKHSKIINK